MHTTARPEIKPQPGFQEMALSTPADLAILGAAAGVGKSWLLEVEAARNVPVPGYGAVIFRRTTTQIRAQGGLWDSSTGLYPHLGGNPRESLLEWTFPKHGSKIKFTHLEHEKNKLDWQGSEIPFIGFDELTHFCMHPDTEVLTENGWKRITQVKEGELVPSLSPNRSIKYLPVSGTHAFDFDGELICANQRNGVAFKVTPNHRTVVNMQDEAKSWKFVRADHLCKTVQVIPRAGNFEGKEIAEYVFNNKPKGRGHGRNSNNADKIKMDDWLEFLGWYFSEGCAFDSDSPRVNIRQTKINDSLTALKNRLPFRCFQDTNEGGFSIFSRQLFNELKPLGTLYTKRVPRWIFKLSKRQIKIFVNAFVAGDGHTTPTGAIHIGLANDGLIDDLQELFFLLGRVATKGRAITKEEFVVYRLSVSKQRTATHINPHNIYKEKYKGKVYCLTVPENHTFYTRLNGRASWTGNTETQFWYMVSRNRSDCGVRPYMRATCNPDPSSWVYRLVEWYIDPITGFPIKERNGVLRYYTRVGGTLVWGDTKEEVLLNAPQLMQDKEFLESGLDPLELVKSFTFIAGSIYENKIFLQRDPGYLGNLLSLQEEEKARLLGGNWLVSLDGLSLCDPRKLPEIFTNYPETAPNALRCITCDAARFGRDFCVIYVWRGWEVVFCVVMLKSDAPFIVKVIEGLRKQYAVMRRDVIVDQDGVGGGSVHLGGYTGFSGGAPPKRDPDTRIKEVYENFKTQCMFRFARELNEGGVRFSLNNETVVVYEAPESTGIRGTKIAVKGGIKDIKDLVLEDFRTWKRRETPNEGSDKLKAITKEDQKAILGRSPDFGDTAFMRAAFALRPEEKTMSRAN